MSSAVHMDGASVGWDYPVVDGITIDVPAGSSLALIGTNGSGKSTILRTLAGLLPPIGGRVSVLDGPPGANPARVAYVGQFHPQGFVLPLRVRDVVAMGRYPRLGLLGRPRRADADAVDHALGELGIKHLADRALRELSGGQRQRVYVAQAIAQQADVILLDEPASGLDLSARTLLRAAIACEVDRGAAVLFATHDLGDARTSDQVMVLAGRVVSAGPPATALSRDAIIAGFGLVLEEFPEGGPIALDPGHAHGHHDDHDHGAAT